MMPAPKKQFSRPAIDLTRSEKRSWEWIAASEVRAGDTVAEVGLIESTGFKTVSRVVLFYNVNGDLFEFAPTKMLYTFVRVDG